MKKILTICVFAFALLISSQGFAQGIKDSSTSIDKSSVKENVMKIATTLGLDEKQTNAFAEAYMNREKTLKAEKANLTSDAKAKVQDIFLNALKGVLTEDQLSKLKALSSEK